MNESKIEQKLSSGGGESCRFYTRNEQTGAELTLNHYRTNHEYGTLQVREQLEVAEILPRFFKQ